MKDTIYREDAIKALGDAHFKNWGNAVMIIQDLPSADRPQGKWKAKSFHECFCHNCGFSFDIMKCEFLENMKYCPNCGVRKGADDE